MAKTHYLLALSAALITAQASAHDLWVNAHGSVGKPVRAEIGYGHDFPQAEKIPEKRLGIFEPMVLVAEDGQQSVLTQKGENYQYTGHTPLQKGVYIVTATYKPTFWSQKQDGTWEQGMTRKDLPDAKYCEQAAMYGKSILTVGHVNSDFATHPIGQKLEIVPMEDIANFRVKKPFTVQVLYDGKPLKTTKVSGTFAGFPKDQKAFVGTTDLEGKIAIMPLHQGQWMLQAEHKPPYGDLKTCDEYVTLASLVLTVQ